MAVKRFIIVGMQRSGTTVTHVCLAGHPNVAMAVDEVYVEPFYTRGLATFTGGKESYDDRKAGFARLFDLLASSSMNEDTRACGIKTAIRNHADSISFANCLREYLPDVAVVIVSRDDLVAQYGSLIRAEKSGEWHRTEGVKSNFDGRFALDKSGFSTYAQDSISSLAQLRTLAATHRVHEINYERDIVPGTGYEPIFEFLEIPVIPPTWLRMSKVAPPARDFITNYDAMQARQRAISSPTPDEELELARTELRRSAALETPSFLLHRATDRLKCEREEDAILDVLDAMSSQQRVDLWLRGAVYGELESLARHAKSRDEALRALAAGAESAPVFRLNRARIRLQHDLARSAVDDAFAALQTPLDPRSFDARHAFDLLETGLDKLQDLDLANRLLEDLAPPYGECPSYWLLKALLLRSRNDSHAARDAARRVLELSPDHPRAKRLLQELERTD